MLDSAPLVTLGFAYFFYLIAKEFDDEIKHFLIFFSLLFVPYACFVTGAVADANSAPEVAALLYPIAWIIALVIFLLFSLYWFGYYSELKKQKGKIKI